MFSFLFDLSSHILNIMVHRQTQIQKDRKQCVCAHFATCTGGLSKKVIILRFWGSHSEHKIDQDITTQLLELCWPNYWNCVFSLNRYTGIWIQVRAKLNIHTLLQIDMHGISTFIMFKFEWVRRYSLVRKVRSIQHTSTYIQMLKFDKMSKLHQSTGTDLSLVSSSGVLGLESPCVEK